MGSGSQNALKNSTLPSATNVSINSSDSARTRGSSAAITFGANSGSSSLRYLVCASPSSISGMSGRPAPMYAAANSIIDGIHRVHVAPLRHRQHVGHAHDGDAAVLVADDPRTVQQAVHVGLDVDDPVDEGTVRRRSGSHCFHVFLSDSKRARTVRCAFQRR